MDWWITANWFLVPKNPCFFRHFWKLLRLVYTKGYTAIHHPIILQIVRGFTKTDTKYVGPTKSSFFPLTFLLTLLIQCMHVFSACQRLNLSSACAASSANPRTHALPLQSLADQQADLQLREKQTYRLRWIGYFPFFIWFEKFFGSFVLFKNICTHWKDEKQTMSKPSTFS